MGKGRLGKHFVRHSCSEPSGTEFPGALEADTCGNPRGERQPWETGAAEFEPSPYTCYEALLLFT